MTTGAEAAKATPRGDAGPARESGRVAIFVARHTEEGRSFQQHRLGQFALVVLVVGLCFDLLANTLAFASGASSLARLSSLPGNQAHGVLLVGLFGLVWLCRRGRLSSATLGVVDFVSAVAISAAHGIMGVGSPQAAHPALQGPVVTAASSTPMLLATIFILLSRAIVLPSSARRTLLVSAAAALPTLFGAHLLHLHYPVGSLGQTAAQQTMGAVIWLASGVALATFASKTIYQLQARVENAMELGQYTLLEKIGEGGMGAVYMARHALLRRPTAVKLLPPETAGAHNLARFEREVQLTSKLTHPNTVAVYDYGRTADGVFYYAMEFLDGMNLEDLVTLDGPQDPARVVHILRQVAGALSEAHGVGLVHRDVKPANIMLCERGGVPDVAKVLDFGLARELDDAGSRTEAGVTGANTILGTPLYLSPEVIKTPERIDGRADLYSLGAVGYHLLVGEPVFSAKTAIEACGHHLHSPVVRPSLRLGTELPRALEAIVMRCLEKSADARPENARELSFLLAEVGLPTWTEAQARACWERARLKQPPSSRTAGGRTPASSTPGVTIRVDLQRRSSVAPPTA